MSEEQLTAESDKSPGVLLSSGYIAGGAIAGIVIAIMQGAFSTFDARLTDVMTAHNAFFAGSSSDLLSLLPFLILCGLLYLVGRERLLSGRRPAVPL
jgi:hypothetical protein